ncbi:hypothetical protein [Streptomyces sp. B3I8]|uniref:hypothetical protein n=1 Tax=Streptomyces sp. B3I8 TaxID=3042303 RepID=UPI0027D90384|nr:hypothetical protein [Streptomyces sp. B3I8]
MRPARPAARWTAGAAPGRGAGAEGFVSGVRARGAPSPGRTLRGGFTGVPAAGLPASVFARCTAGPEASAGVLRVEDVGPPVAGSPVPLGTVALRGGRGVAGRGAAAGVVGEGVRPGAADGTVSARRPPGTGPSAVAGTGAGPPTGWVAPPGWVAPLGGWVAVPPGPATGFGAASVGASVGASTEGFTARCTSVTALLTALLPSLLLSPFLSPPLASGSGRAVTGAGSADSTAATSRGAPAPCSAAVRPVGAGAGVAPTGGRTAGSALRCTAVGTVADLVRERGPDGSGGAGTVRGADRPTGGAAPPAAVPAAAAAG